ncbi:MAG: NAD(P)H-dependent oxidoreductase subunit E [Tissierellia bacterium]|nr:NAD(P)H-dependent oxidoreductase subunit E [Tissierellia bacterium]
MTQVKFNADVLQTYYDYLDEIMKEDVKGKSMLILQKMQEVFGYIPKDVLLETSKKTGIASSELYGVATFYHQFTFTPKGKHIIQICLGTACYVKGGGAILQKIEDLLDIKDGMTSENGHYSIDTTRCVGECGIAPVVIVDGVTHAKVKLDEVEDILAEIMEESL